MTIWPKLYKIQQKLAQPTLDTIENEVKREIDFILSNHSLPQGAKIGITAGSRGIYQIVKILYVIVQVLKEHGYHPFLFSAMGSHGGGTAEGQLDILHHIGITEETMGCPVIASSDVLQIGITDQGIKGLSVYIAKEAYEADGILVVNRIKPHTSFRGEYESGLLKMMAVGMGRREGAEMVHRLGVDQLAYSIPSIAKKMMEIAPFLGGLGIVENGMEQTALLKGTNMDEILTVEKELLVQAKAFMPNIPVKKIDVAIIQEMGKNFSGTGMDTNVIGRMRIEGIPEPDHIAIQYLAVLDLTEESQGNATGIGLADFTTEKLVNKMDKQKTYLNCLTSGFVTRAAIPMTFSDDETLFSGIGQVFKQEDLSLLRLVILQNTLHIDQFWVSETIYQELKNISSIEVLEGPLEIQFDSHHQFII
ncbi:DUF362 domain-containing protein [Tepidibacillus marianensis]|uniref:DUF362 domain-containing protein n=1 Tax=Tepidibacillus marianensis TaxID=3131995 RepID=UPI0030D182A5